MFETKKGIDLTVSRDQRLAIVVRLLGGGVALPSSGQQRLLEVEPDGPESFMNSLTI